MTAHEAETGGLSDWDPAWHKAITGDGCGMCGDKGQADTGYGVRFLTGRFAHVYLQRSGVVRGYSVAIWQGEHVAEPTQLTPDEHAGFWDDVAAAARAMEAVYRPVKMNYLGLGNGLPHLHVHLVPRYALGDPAPNGPLPHHFLDDGRQDEELLLRDVVDLTAAVAGNSEGGAWHEGQYLLHSRHDRT